MDCLYRNSSSSVSSAKSFGSELLREACGQEKAVEPVSARELGLVLKRFYFLWAQKVAKQSIGNQGYSHGTPLNILKELMDESQPSLTLKGKDQKKLDRTERCHFLALTYFFFSPGALPDLFLFSFRLVVQLLLLGESEKVLTVGSLSFQEQIQVEQLPLSQQIEYS